MISHTKVLIFLDSFAVTYVARLIISDAGSATWSFKHTPFFFLVSKAFVTEDSKQGFVTLRFWHEQSFSQGEEELTERNDQMDIVNIILGCRRWAFLFWPS